MSLTLHDTYRWISCTATIRRASVGEDKIILGVVLILQIVMLNIKEGSIEIRDYYFRILQSSAQQVL
jgi:hypothetical protein